MLKLASPVIVSEKEDPIIFSKFDNISPPASPPLPVPVRRLTVTPELELI